MLNFFFKCPFAKALWFNHWAYAQKLFNSPLEINNLSINLNTFGESWRPSFYGRLSIINRFVLCVTKESSSLLLWKFQRASQHSSCWVPTTCSSISLQDGCWDEAYPSTKPAPSVPSFRPLHSISDDAVDSDQSFAAFLSRDYEGRSIDARSPMIKGRINQQTWRPGLQA